MASETLTRIILIDSLSDLLPEVETRMRTSSNDNHPELDTAIEHLLSSGGKRIRPTIALLTGGMLSGDREKLITLAAAIEMLHTATLVHDDLIDGALLRRGISTLNARWSPAATVLTGDFIFARAARLAADTESVELIRLFAETLATIVNGEITQMFPGEEFPNRQNYNKRIYAKTASLFELSTCAAAILSPVNEKIVDEMREFGYKLGMAFQIVDDVLDFTGQQAEVGKPVASDLRQGIVTLPVIYYHEINPCDEDLEFILSGIHYEETVMNRLVSSIKKSGAIQKAIQEAKAYVEAGLHILVDKADNPDRRALEDLAYYIVDRNV